MSNPDLSARPFSLTAEREMRTSIDVLFRAFTRDLDRWIATPGSVLLQPRVNTAFYFETEFRGQHHAHYGRFLRIKEPTLVDLTWVTSATRGAETQLTVELIPHHHGTLLRLTHAGFPDEESRKRHENAWPEVLALLDQCMTAV